VDTQERVPRLEGIFWRGKLLLERASAATLIFEEQLMRGKGFTTETRRHGEFPQWVGGEEKRYGRERRFQPPTVIWGQVRLQVDSFKAKIKLVPFNQVVTVTRLSEFLNIY